MTSIPGEIKRQEEVPKIQYEYNVRQRRRLKRQRQGNDHPGNTSAEKQNERSTEEDQG